MLGTLFHRVTVRTLDRVVDAGRASTRSPVRVAAGVLDRARRVVGLDNVARRDPMPQWSPEHPERPMWGSDRKKLEKFRVDHGIEPKTADAEESKDETAARKQGNAPVRIFFKRGCPYTRAALDLLREREIAFEDVDVTGDEGTLSWLKIVTGKRTTPQIFIQGEHLGGFDELRALDQSGELAKRVAGDKPTPAAGNGKIVRKIRKLPVVHPERSPFEALAHEDFTTDEDETLDGDALVARVREVLDECRPLVQADGGDIELLDVQGDIVHVQLTGNCIGCPSSQATLRQGIERRLKQRIPQVQGIASPQLA